MKITNKLIILVVILLIIFGAIFIVKRMSEGNPFSVRGLLIGLPDACKRRASGTGACFGISSAYEYNASAKKCKDTPISGCSVISPFKTLEDCKKICE